MFEVKRESEQGSERTNLVVADSQYRGDAYRYEAVGGQSIVSFLL